MKLYKVTIQDGENTYEEWTTTKADKNYVDGTLRAVKDITVMEATQQEIKTLQKLRVL